jgi:N-alpha-acetyltransferase 50
MPQTSLLSFLTSPVSYASDLSSIPKSKSESSRNPQDQLKQNEVPAVKRETHEVLRKSPEGTILTKLRDQNAVQALRSDLERGADTEGVTLPRSVNAKRNQQVKEEEEQEQEQEQNQKQKQKQEGNTTRPMSSCPSTSSSQSSLTTFTLPDFPSITINPIHPDHLPALRRLTTTLLPIKFSDTFYNESISSPTAASICRVALYTPPNTSSVPIPIGWIRCSLDPLPETSSPSQNTPTPTNPQLYIKVLCLLAPYRHMGVATALLDSTLQQQKEFLREQNVQFVFAHVWESNEEALEWYAKRGFERKGELVESYYRKLRPGGAWVVRREVGS